MINCSCRTACILHIINHIATPFTFVCYTSDFCFVATTFSITKLHRNVSNANFSGDSACSILFHDSYVYRNVVTFVSSYSKVYNACILHSLHVTNYIACISVVNVMSQLKNLHMVCIIIILCSPGYSSSSRNHAINFCFLHSYMQA